MNEPNKKPSFIDKLVDFVFSDDKRKWLILIFLLGAILRFIVARNISALGDEMVHGPHAIGFLHSGLISTILHSSLWFYLTDIFMKVLGVTLFSTRFLSFFYGSLTIIVIYLIASQIFNKRMALLSSFLLSVSFYTIRYTLAEMDLSALFFLTLAIYFFIDAIQKRKFPILAAVSIGVASLIKTLSLFFVPAFLIAFFIFNKDKEQKIKIKENLKKAFVFGIIILTFFSPIIIHNYLWYKDKGMVDTYVAQYFDIDNVREKYAGQLGYDSGFLTKKFFDGLKTMSKTIFSLDKLIVPLGLLGIIISFSLKQKREYWYFLILFQFFGFMFLLLSNHLPTHYVTMIPLLCLFGGFSINEVISKVHNFDKRKLIFILIIAIIIFQIYQLLPHLSSRSAIAKTRDYAISDMDKNSIVIVDSRIYRGRIAFMFNDFHYIESSLFGEVSNLNQQLPGENIKIKVYFVECARDDCGWGTITSGPLNDSSEQMVEQISSQISAEKIFLGGGGYDEEIGDPYIKIYQTAVELKPQAIQLIDSTHDWFYYPVNYIPKEEIWDNYEVYGTFDNLLYSFAWLIIIFSIILAFILPTVMFIRLVKSSN
jgi:hypothetical protein